MYRKLLFRTSPSRSFFIDVTLKSSMAHYKLMMFGYITTFSSSKRHPNSYLVAQNVFGYCNFLGQKRSFETLMTSHRRLSVAKGLKLPDLIVSLLWLLKTQRGYKTFFFAHNVSLCNSVTLKFWVTLEFSRSHGNLKPKRFKFRIEYNPFDRTCPFHYQWLELFGLLEENSIESNVAFLKCFSIFRFEFDMYFMYF